MIGGYLSQIAIACVIIMSCESASMKQMKSLYEESLVHSFEKQLESTGVTSCYFSDKSGGATPVECKAQECATMSFFAHLPNVKDPEQIFSYFYLTAACTEEVKKENCDAVVNSLPYPVTGCEMSCCTTNDCKNQNCLLFAE